MASPSTTARSQPETSLSQDERLPETPFASRAGALCLLALAPGAVVYLSFERGGYFPNSIGLVTIALAAALVLRTTLAEHPFEGYTRQLATILLSLGFFALWELSSALWSHDLSRALDQYNRTLLYLLTLALFGSFPSTPARTRWLIRSLAAAMTAVAFAGLLSRILPHVLPTASTFYASRLSYPLTYWNADGLMFALASLFLIHLAASDELPAARIIAAALVPATVVALLLTFSRGAIGVGLIGLGAYLVLGRPRGLLGAAVALVPTAAVALHAGYGAQLLATDTPTSPAAIAEGRHVAVIVGLCMIAAACLRALMLRPEALVLASVERRHVQRFSRRKTRLAAGAAVMLGALTLVVSGVASHAWAQFAHGQGANPTVTRDRLSDISGEQRTVVWGVALRAFRSRPLTGYGAGTFEFYYSQHRPISGTLTDAHELYLQTLAELGLVGFVALTVALLGVLGGFASRIRGPDRTQFAALFAATLAWVLAATIDWDWQMAAVTIWLFAVAGSALASGRTPVEVRFSTTASRTPMAVGWLLIAIAPLLIGVSYARLRVSGQEFASGNCVHARQGALSAISLLPVRPEPYEILSFCDLELGFPVEALSAARKAANYEPDNWNYQYGLALALAENGLDPNSAADRARTLNPREPIVQDEVSAFAKTGPSGWEEVAPDLLIGGLQSGRLAVTNL